jgi:hypothetical protein
MRGQNLVRVPSYEIGAASSRMRLSDWAAMVVGRVRWDREANGHSQSSANPKTLGQDNLDNVGSWGPE